jgi:serine/threonine protein kinase
MTFQPGNRPVPNYPDYVLIRKLGAGAFGEVWHARGPGGLDVALKFIRLDPHVRAVELRSLDVMKSIRHPNLVSLFGAWHKDNWLILAMELCDRTLQDRLVEALEQNLPGIPLPELLNYMSDAANGLDALNAKQVQHRDVKPANLLLLNSGVKVADFGLAKALEQTVATNSGAGTLAYTAPECFKGKLTQQSDQYSLAVTYYHLRTGQLLFRGDQARIMYAHLEMEPNLSHLPTVEETVVARALSKEPGKRWPSCKMFVNELIAAANARKSAVFYYNRGMEWRKKKDYDKAVNDFDEAIRVDPKYVDAYERRGLTWEAKGEYEKATKDFDEANRLRPNAFLYFYVSRFRLAKGEYDKAIKDLTEAIRLDPTDTYYQVRAEAWYSRNDYDKAINDFDEAIRLNPMNAHAYFWRGIAWAHKGDLEKANENYDRAIFFWAMKKGLVVALDEAIKDYDEAIRLNPNEASFPVERQKREAERAVERQRQELAEWDDFMRDYEEECDAEDAVDQQCQEEAEWDNVSRAYETDR